MRAAVLGDPVAHSLSPVLHRAAWDSLGIGDDWTFERIRMDGAGLEQFLPHLLQGWAGVAVTMPCKQAVIPLLDAVDPLAQSVGAVNTVIPSGGTLTGFNTDVHGIAEAIKAVSPGPWKKALILGSGATASSALAATGYLHIPDVVVASRRAGGPGSVFQAALSLGLSPTHVPWRNQAALVEAVSQADVVISTMPAHICDDLAKALEQATVVRREQVVLDVVYQPRMTALRSVFEHAHAHVAPGLSMLVHQAVPQCQLMCGRTPSVDAMKQALLGQVGSW